jgi:uncharacterized membrane protein
MLQVRQGHLAPRILRLVMDAFFCLAGIRHPAITEDFVAHMAAWAPARHSTVILAACRQLLDAAALTIPKARKFAGVMLAMFPVRIFPANIQEVMSRVPLHGSVAGWGFNGPRLALQPVLVWRALF